MSRSFISRPAPGSCLLVLLFSIVALTASLAVQGAVCAAAAEAQNALWPMFGRTAQHEGRSPVVGAQSAALAWSLEIGDTGMGASSPIVDASGTLYVTDTTGLTALTPGGVPLWNYRPGGTLSMPALGADGAIFLGTSAGLTALTAAGTPAWIYPSGQTGGPVVAQDGTVFAVGDGPAVYALRPGGALLWRRPLPGIYGVPALGPAGAVYVNGFYKLCGIEGCVPFGRLFTLDPATGRPRLVFANRSVGYFTSPPVVIPDGTIFVGTGLGALVPALYAIRPDGKLLWRHPVGGFILSPPAIGTDGTLYVGAGDGFLYALRSDGSRDWRYETEGVGGPGEGSLGMTSSPVVGGDGTIYVGSQDGFVYALDRYGFLKWRHHIAGGTGERAVIQSSPAIGWGGTLYIAGWIDNPQPTRCILFAFGPDPPAAFR